jgi:hypothetical protein
LRVSWDIITSSWLGSFLRAALGVYGCTDLE